jgi:peptidoglycan-N-acetylmuramic acid deacetylase
MILKKIKKLSLFLTIALVFNMCACIKIQASEEYGWYCKRTKDHTQPSLPSEFGLISEYDCMYIDASNSDPNASEKKAYLTFDAGYENGNIEKILNVLSENDVRGAFFILSNLIKTSPELVKRMADEGHLVCNHTSKHKDMSKVSDIGSFESELESLERLYTEATGKKMSKYFRPPEGKFSKKTLEFASQLGYKTVFWSFAYADWDNGSQMDPNAAKRKILDNIHNGAIILLHPTSATNAAILGDIIKELKNQGYSFGMLDEIDLDR